MSDDAPLLAYRHPPAVALFFILAAAVLGADLWLKAWAFANVAPQPVIIDPAQIQPIDHEPVIVVPYLLNLHLTTNDGAVFGMGKGQRFFFITMSLIAIVVIVVIFARSFAQQRWLHVSLALILAGALGNLYDRAVYSQVRDMLHLFPGVNLPFGWAWPGPGGGIRELYPWIFNIADVALVVGVLMMMVNLWKPRPNKATSDQAEAKTADTAE